MKRMSMDIRLEVLTVPVSDVDRAKLSRLGVSPIAPNVTKVSAV
jgi:hypothetical protein